MTAEGMDQLCGVALFLQSGSLQRSSYLLWESKQGFASESEALS